jgi:hypothetical protein
MLVTHGSFLLLIGVRIVSIIKLLAR